MELTCVFLCFVVLRCITDVAGGVCSNITYTTLDDIRRSTAYDSTFDLCDRGVIQDGSWYRFNSLAGDKMPEFNPGVNHCGTYVPIWMNGKHPIKLGETVDRTACAAIPFRKPVGCFGKFDIKVINCDEFFLYQLKDPKACNLAYCAGSKKIDPSKLKSPSSSPPRIINITASSNLLFEDIYLKCEVQGNPSPNVWWTKNNIRLENGDKTLVIRRAYIYDDGIYHCHARNNLSQVNASIVLNLMEFPRNSIQYTGNDGLPYTLRSSTHQLRRAQKDFNFNCHALGYPKLRVTWTRNGIEILDLFNSSLNPRVYQERQKNIRDYGSSILYFKEVSCHDAGIYSCKSSIEGYDSVGINQVHVEVISCSSNFSQSIMSTLATSSTILPVPTSYLVVPAPVFMTTVVTSSTELSSKFITTSTPSSVFATPSLVFTQSGVTTMSPPFTGTTISPQFTGTTITSSQFTGTTITSSQFTGTTISPPFTGTTISPPFTGTTITSSQFTGTTISPQFTGTVGTGMLTPTPSYPLYLSNLYVTPTNPTVLENSFIVLSCNCGCPAQPHWFKNNQSIQYDGREFRYSLLSNGSLRINVSRHTAGNYSCEIRSRSLFARSKQIGLDVRYLDNCHIRDKKRIYRGENISLTCHGNGNPHPLFSLYLKGQELKTNSGVRIQGNKLDIFNATMNHGGQYKCVAYNEVGNVTCDVIVNVTDIPPIVISTNATKYTVEGTEIQFKCDSALQSFQHIEGMELVKDGIPFHQPIVRYSTHYSTPWFGAQKKDTGKYQCKGTIGAASRYSSPLYLIVGVPSGPIVLDKEPESSSTGIRLSWKPISNTFWNGEEITFQVDVLSDDYNLIKSHTTKKNSAIISGLFPATKYIVNIIGRTVFGPMENRAVTVTTTEDVDECENKDSNSCHEYAHCRDVVGTYICTCFDGFFGNGKECRGPAQITAKSPANITQYVETNVTLVCTVIADPNPTIVWKHIDVDDKVKEIKPTSNKFDGSITIYNARLEDSGTYLCNASNELGYDFYSTEIKIKPVIVNISVEIKLSNKTFNEELKNKSSPAYKELKEDVYFELYNFFNDTPGFEDIEILGFVKGSVKVMFKVIVKVLKPSKERNDVVAVKVGRKIYKQLKTGRIGKFSVAPEALKLNAEPPPPANVSYSDVKETKVHIFWDPPELHELFSIERYYISFLKHGETKWLNDTIDDDQLTNFLLDNLESDTFYTLKVTAENRFYLGQESKKMEIKTLKAKVVSPWYYLGPVIAIVCVILLLVLICFVKQAVCSGSLTLVESRRPKSNEKEETESFLMVDRGESSKDKCTSVKIKGIFKPAWKEIPPKSIEVFNDTIIPGNFGSIVVRGTFSFNSGKKRETCSIKMLKENATAEDRRDLMNELKIISAIGHHENIVNLIGACTSEQNPLLLVLEFCSLGTLESNLRDSSKSKEMFQKQNRISLANEIAKGMKHLSDARIVHRDLAARNILVTSNFTPKISNFGLSRDIYERSSYQKLSSGKLPVRWMAIESFTDGLYTMKSDVWSFAVVMWEIETEGEIPYQKCQELGVIELVNQIKKGYRLSKPDQTPDERYKLMLQCWDPDPVKRPTFNDIVEITRMHVENNKSLIDVPHSIYT